MVSALNSQHWCFIQAHWFSYWVEFYLCFPSSLMQDSVQQWWCTGQGDGEGTSGRGLWDMWQRFRRADCSALCRTYHCHQDVPEHHRAHHQLPQQDQTGRKERLVYQSRCWTKWVWKVVKTFTRLYPCIVTDFRAVTLNRVIKNKTRFSTHFLIH